MNCVYSAARYIKNLQYNDDGEIFDSKTLLYLDEERIVEETKYDGYYAIVSSELNMSDNEVIDIYHDLWKIEETFKISKSDLKTRPVYVTLEEHISSSFSNMFRIASLAESSRIKNEPGSIAGTRRHQRFSAFTLLDSLRKFSCSYMAKNLYSFHYIDDNLSAIESVLDLNLNRKYMTRDEIKKIIAKAKK